MNARKLGCLIALLLLVLVAACAPAAKKAPAVTVMAEKAAAREAVPTAAPASTMAPKAVEQPAADGAGSAPDVSAYQVGRMIIKSGQMALVVADTDRALNDVTRIAADNGGYVVSSETGLQGDFKYATLTLGVPVERFEKVQSEVRKLALRIVRDSASGEDVSDQYVDLQSRLTNLEATEARIRTFLDQAKTVEEALKVNAQLAEVEAQIEQVKGRMNYLKDRAAFSTLTVELQPELPTPTVTPTFTPTPTPTPNYWQPVHTAEQAGSALGSVLRVLADLLIWVVIVLGPFIVIVVLLYLFLRAVVKRPKGPKPPTA